MSDSHAPGDRPETPGHAAWRHWVLARVMPAVAHRMNNSQAVVLGLVDLMQRDGDARRVDEIRREATAHSNLIHLLSQLAKSHPVPGTSDLRRSTVRSGELVGCVAHHAGLEFTCNPPPQASLPVSSARAESLLGSIGTTLVHLATAPATASAASGRLANRARLRLSFRARGTETLVVQWTAVGAGQAPWPSIGSEPPERVFEILREEWAPHGVDLRFRTGRLGLACRASLPVARVDTPAPTPRAEKPTILLWMRDASLTELVRAVLDEQGYSVHPLANAPRPAAHPEAALLILDQGLATRETLAGFPYPILELPPGAPRPTELFAAIEARLG